MEASKKRPPPTIAPK
jgi:site-specific recombinase XerD